MALLPKFYASLIILTVDTISLEDSPVYGDLLTPATIEPKVQSAPYSPPLTDFNQICFFWTDFVEISPVGAKLMRRDGKQKEANRRLSELNELA